MTTLAQSGLAVTLPAGWEGRIYRRAPEAALPGEPATSRPAVALVGRTNPVLHLANFPLAPDVADYGGGAVEVMTNTDLFVALIEFGPGSIGQALFAAQGMPRLKAEDFGTQSMQRVLEGQGGAQKWFTEAGRAFGLYVVLGSYARRFRTVPVVNGILATIAIT
jgi:hypothetical protein